MNQDQRKTFRIQIPEGREHASLLVGKQQVGVRILDESAGGFAVALLTDEDIQQNQVHVLKTASGLYKTRVARIEHFEDGKLLGLMRLQDLSETDDSGLKDSSWRDYFFVPSQATGAGGGLAIGIGATVVVGMLICVMAAYYIKYSPARRDSAASPLMKEYSEALTEKIEKAREAAKVSERLANEKERVSGGVRQSAEFVRRQARVSQEVLYRLQLDSDQSRRIRDILSRTSGDPTSAEAEIRSVLTAEQARQWQSLAP